MKTNGLLIDCSRLMERHEYYPRLLDFMADWGMNTLVLHFSDDHGLAVRLRGFEDLAMPAAFTPREARALVAHARRRGIAVIPELETFGHTRYLTDHPACAHLYAGRRTRRVTFNAVDPLHPDTLPLMKRLIRATADLFDCRVIHVGCDEVAFNGYFDGRPGLDETTVWVDYVNAVLGLVRECGCVPMLWGDHPAASPPIARRLRKDVVLVWWRYGAEVTDRELRGLRAAGFRRLVAAPSVACYNLRFLPSRSGLRNVRRMHRHAQRHGIDGLINTVWCPYRYLQGAMYYGIAFSAWLGARGGRGRRAAFNREFARRVFGTPLSRDLRVYLAGWPELEIDGPVARKLYAGRTDLTPEEWSRVERVSRAGRRIVPLAGGYRPRCNGGIWDAMRLAGEAAWLCSEALRLARAGKRSGSAEACRAALRRVRREAARMWDATRFPDDPRKRRPAFPGTGSEYALLLLRAAGRLLTP